MIPCTAVELFARSSATETVKFEIMEQRTHFVVSDVAYGVHAKQGSGEQALSSNRDAQGSICTGVDMYSRAPNCCSGHKPKEDHDPLKALFRSTSGGGWDNKANWAARDELSTWHGVKTDEGGRVVELQLALNNLRGMC